MSKKVAKKVAKKKSASSAPPAAAPAAASAPTTGKRKLAKKKPTADQPLAGARVVFDKRLSAKGPRHLTARIEALGGMVDATLDQSTTLLLTDDTKRTSEVTQAEKLVAKGATIEVLPVATFVERHALTADEVLGLLRGDKAGTTKLQTMLEHPWNVAGFPLPSLGKADLRKLSLRDVRLHRLTLQDADLRDADLCGCSLEGLVGCDLRGAKLDRASFDRIERCQLQGASLDSAYPSAIRDSDLRQASLEGVSLSYRELSGCNLAGVDLTNAELTQIKLQRSNLEGAKLAGAQLADADLSGANLTGADLTSAMLTKAKLVEAKLERANLTKANLGGADLTGATLAGADFTEANLAGATVPKLEGNVQVKGLAEALADQGGEIGPRLRELETIAKAAERIQTAIAFDMPDGSSVSVDIDAKTGNWSRVYVRTRHGNYHRGDSAESLAKALQDTANKWGKGTPKLDALTVKSSKSPVGGKELRHLVTAAWCEVCGIEPPAAPAPKAGGKPTKAQRERALVDALLDELRSGPEGVQRWNDRSHEAWAKLGKGASFARSELTGAKLDGMKMHGLDFSLSTFNGASLRNAEITDGKLDQASLVEADLTGATLGKTSMIGADLRKAKLDQATLRECDLSGDSKLSQTRLVGTKLPGTKIVSDAMDVACMQDVDLSGTDLAGCRFYGGKHTGTFDGYTRFPPNYKPPEGLKGPRDAKGMPKLAADAGFDLADFLARLKVTVGTSSYEKGKKLLKRSRFKLFHQVEDERMIAIVKSETDASLLYACILGDKGYSCCTHNLNRCGGLSFGPCKHMMVMILGLAQAGEVDAEKVDAWVQASKKSGPRLDKDVAAEVFLRYKGAEAGEIDWRPTETVPEDFYAF
ncbi:pentapeptide repeat-containing protein [Paraliomyxa miuraensis]|uniref:pentapeptide repeat-containing protein n=1 Tax=Paraliomyxa miuraensis TaxID=376150 RepID=UPI002258355B|nr:pentapeptide repeat-containing protein [Paraliomyxa miuraensis]MCX4247675.1 pentapeptide repeat-containing protein [Paraliomyxa miuraensis]